MIVRCGACRSQFDVPGPGRFSCPVCGSVNEVRAAANGPQGGPQPGPAPGGMGGGPGGGAMPGGPGGGIQTPPPPKPETPSPKISCPECEFSFIVGEISVATCPMCGAEVETGIEVEDEA